MRLRDNLRLILTMFLTFIFLLLAGPIGLTVFLLSLFQYFIPAFIYVNRTSDEQKIKDMINDNDSLFEGLMETNKEFKKRLRLIKEKEKLGITLDYNDTLALDFLHRNSVENIKMNHSKRKDEIEEIKQNLNKKEKWNE